MNMRMSTNREHRGSNPTSETLRGGRDDDRFSVEISGIKLKHDHYRRIRGGTAALIELRCAKCTHALLLYQKDGEGSLLRCYLNRILAPIELERLQRDPAIRKPGDMPPLICPSCAAPVGFPMRHHDQRLAFRLLRGSFQKRVVR